MNGVSVLGDEPETTGAGTAGDPNGPCEGDPDVPDEGDPDVPDEGGPDGPDESGPGGPDNGDPDGPAPIKYCPVRLCHSAMHATCLTSSAISRALTAEAPMIVSRWCGWLSSSWNPLSTSIGISDMGGGWGGTIVVALCAVLVWLIGPSSR
jgi:hypothetical protein